MYLTARAQASGHKASKSARARNAPVCASARVYAYVLPQRWSIRRLGHCAAFHLNANLA